MAYVHIYLPREYIGRQKNISISLTAIYRQTKYTRYDIQYCNIANILGIAIFNVNILLIYWLLQLLANIA